MGTIHSLHRQIAPLDAALAAGNRNARNAGRKRWNDEDREAAARVYYNLTGVAPEKSGLVRDLVNGPPVHERIPAPTPLSDLRDLVRDCVEFAHVLALGICLGCLATVLLAYFWAGALS